MCILFVGFCIYYGVNSFFGVLGFLCLFLHQHKHVKKPFTTTFSSGNIFAVNYLSSQTDVEVCLTRIGSLYRRLPPTLPPAHLPPCRASCNCSSEWLERRGACWVCQRRKQRSSCATFCSCCRQEIPTWPDTDKSREPSRGHVVQHHGTQWGGTVGFVFMWWKKGLFSV